MDCCKLRIAGGAEAVIIPEHDFDIDKDIILPIIEGRNRGKKNYLVIVAEGIVGVSEIAKYIEEITDIITRETFLGHIQRGGSPTMTDRVMASRMGVYAVELLKNGQFNRVVASKGGRIVDYDIDEALNMKKTIDEELINIGKILAL